MVYRVRADMCFNELDEATGAMDDCKKWLPRAVNINEGETNEEIGFAQLERCHHEGVQMLPCLVVEHVEVPRA